MIMHFNKLSMARKIFNRYAMQLPHDRFVHFDVFIDAPLGDLWLPPEYPLRLSVEASKRVELLLGPNSYAVFKAYVAQTKLP